VPTLIWDNFNSHYVRFRTDLAACATYLESTERESVSCGTWQQGWSLRPAGTQPRQMEIYMHWDRIQGNWKQVVGKAKAQWGKLTDDDLDVVAGRREQLAGKIQERYGIAKDEVDKQIADWELTATDAWFLKDEKRS